MKNDSKIARQRFISNGEGISIDDSGMSLSIKDIRKEIKKKLKDKDDEHSNKKQ